MLLIIDNQSQFLRTFKRRYLDDREVPHVIVEHNEQIDWSRADGIKGLMLSGGKGNPYEPLNLSADFAALMNLDVPTIGFCLGHEIIGVAHRARIRRMPEYQSKNQLVRIEVPEDPIFAGLPSDLVGIRKQHSFHLPKAPPDFDVLASSDACPVEIMRHRERCIYGFQGHPEVSGTNGIRMLENFLGMCGML